MWGNIIIDSSGDVKAHAGKDWFVTIKHAHCIMIQNLRTDLIDLFLRHFSQKPLTQELLNVRSHIEINIESIMKELQELRDGENEAGFNELLHTLILNDIYLTKESVPLSSSVKAKLYSTLIAEEPSIKT